MSRPNSRASTHGARRGRSFRLLALTSVLAAGLLGAACDPPAGPVDCSNCPPQGSAAPAPSGAAAKKPATAAEAEAFVKKVDEDLRRLKVNVERAGWVQTNFITQDTQAMSAAADQELMEYLSKTIKEATRFDGLKLKPEVARQLKLLKLGGTLPAPSDKKKTAELAKLASDMPARYGKGKYCPKEDGALRKELAKDDANKEALECSADKGGVALGVLTKLLADSRNEEALREAWIGWRSISPPMRKQYERYVALGNEGAKEIGFKNVGELWRSGYDMPAQAFRDDSERLWSQVKPFYEELHCYVRSKLQQHYGEELVPEGKPIPAHLLGNMWSQTWGNIYPLVAPYPDEASLDVTKALEKKKYDEVKMVKQAESFFTSIGLDPLPKTFWERSLFQKPRDRDVVCHASAWDVGYNDDLRIKMCIQITQEEFGVVHHELGHNYYFHYYYKLPILFQSGANDGFHEAIGDAIALSITPNYLKQIDLISEVSDNDKADINYLMKMALEKVAFLPFGKLIDQWRWDVFEGKIAAAKYNQGWWDLRTKYQGIAPPVARSEKDFDPGAKYHVPANVPYIRYFLAFVYQFQFQRALCRAAGHQGPLHKCSIYGNKKAGEKLKALLSLGASRPWQEALEAMSGEKQGDAGALLEYFKPVRGWLKEQIKDQKCGW